MRMHPCVVGIRGPRDPGRKLCHLEEGSGHSCLLYRARRYLQWHRRPWGQLWQAQRCKYHVFKNTGVDDRQGSKGGTWGTDGHTVHGSVRRKCFCVHGIIFFKVAEMRPERPIMTRTRFTPRFVPVDNRLLGRNDVGVGVTSVFLYAICRAYDSHGLNTI